MNILNGDISTSSIQKMSVFASVLCALYSLKKNKESRIEINSINFDDECEIIKKRFSCLYDEFRDIENMLTEKEKHKIYKCLFDVYACADENEKNTISWIYQYLKRDLEKRALGNIGKQQNKIEGKDILLVTQFFTDEYMVKYLVDRVFEIKKEQIPNILFVDPASGGGNFLTYIFDKLYNWYTNHTNLSDIEIVDIILNKNIVGYDLDNHLAKIASLSLFVNSCKYATPSSKTNIMFYGGIDNDILGYVANRITSNIIGGKDFEKAILTAKKSKMDIVYITNPPFMGKRDMDNNLKTHLLKQFPTCKGDLCVSFICKLMEQMQNNDIIAVVSQNGWLNLSSLKLFRKKLLEKYHIYECVDLGSNAFLDINGEKTNVVLCIISKKGANQGKSIFLNLKSKNYQEKALLLSQNKADIFKVDSSSFLANATYEICYQLGVNFTSLKTLPIYSSYAKCMQGTSTGNNKEFVKYFWEIPNNSEWVLVSKGGGYSKWHGLNYYKVRWGDNGALIKSNPGSALRNIEHINNTELVYSDTGTLGLNVRLLKPGKVFIASGPGIKVNQGKPICHLAYLNSRIATFLLKARNPKFTISAGYIGSLPVVESILFSSIIEKHAQICVVNKSQYLLNKLPNVEFKHDDYALIYDIDTYITNKIIMDITNDYCRYEAEKLIDIEIIKAYGFSKSEQNEIYNMVGGLSMVKHDNHSININELDIAITSSLNENCLSVGRKINGYVVGSESLLEIVGYNLGIDPKNLYNMIRECANELTNLKEKYKLDLFHKIILKIVGIDNLEQIEPKKINIDTLYKKLIKQYPLIYKELGVSRELIKDVIIGHHPKSFFNRPILQVYENTIVVGQ